MSIYDDLANSSYMDKQEFVKQLQYSGQQLDESLNGSQQMVNFNQYQESARVNQEDNFMMYQRPSYPHQYETNQTPAHLEDFYNQQSNNFSKINQLLQMSSNQKQDLNQDAGKSQAQQKQGDLHRQLFQKNMAEEELCNFEQQNNHPNYEQTQSERNFQLEDEEIVQAQNLFNNQNQNTQIRTGRFAGVAQVSHRDSNDIGGQHQTLDYFKNNNDQIQQLLQQLQVPQAFNQFNGGPPQPDLFGSGLPPKGQSNYRPTGQGNFLDMYQKDYQQPSGITQSQLNQDNSLLALAQIKPLGSSGSTNQMDQSPIDNDFFLKESNFYTNTSVNYQQQLGGNSRMMMMTNDATPNQQVRNYNPYQIPSGPQTIENGKENQDQNIFNQAPQPQRTQKNTIDNSNIVYYPIDNSEKKKNSQPSNFYSKQISQHEAKRKELMNNFDDIPIKELNKAEGYKQERMEENEDEDHEGDNLPVIDRIDHPKWKVRMRAYKNINDLFYNEHAKEIQRKNGLYNQDQNIDENEERVFDIYGPVMQRIICDQNLVAQYEGLNCLLAYVKFAQDIKTVTLSVHSILLDKVQLNKANFKEITLSILMNIIKKDKSQCVVPELLKRFKNKNSKVASFAMEAILESFIKKSFSEDHNLKNIFKVTADNLSHSNKDLRDIATELLVEIYKLASDDANSFVKNLSQLRPVQLKDIKEMLSEIQKSDSNLIQLFQNQPNENAPQLEGLQRAKTKRDENVEEENEEKDSQGEGQETDLFSLLPDNFSEIPYLSQINVKKKGMETLNLELDKLVQKKQTVINKDYSQIFNVVVHMLEDSNALVFMEAIKTVEFLAILLGKNIKAQKIRQFLGLLAEKYKETKSAVISAVNRTISVIIQKQTLPAFQIIEYFISTLAHNHKNSRVKQLLLEKVEQTLREEDQQQLRDEEVANIFKSVKDKIVNFILKDTNASVRDAAVQLLTTFKMMIPSNQVVNEAINTLPKYRITEINKKALEMQEQRAEGKSQRQSSPKRKESQKAQPVKKPSGVLEAEDFSYKGRKVSGIYQIHLAEIVLSLKKMKQGTFPNPQTLNEKWEDELEKLGEQGIQEVKPVIISCVHWLFSFYNSQKQFANIEILSTLLTLLKKIYCIERSVEIQESGQSQELTEAISITLQSSQWLQNHKLLEGLMNVVLSASGNTQQFIDNLKIQFEKIKEKIQLYSIASIIDFTFKWLINKMDFLLTKGLPFQQFEDLRGLALSFLGDIIDDQQRNNVIRLMINFKTQMNEKQKGMQALQESSIHHHDDDLDEEEDKGEVSKILKSIHESPRNESRDEELKFSELNKPEIEKTKGQLIVEQIDQNFEKGLLMLKEFATSDESQDPQSKELVFGKLFQIVQTHCKNPQQQYQQAYALKALMWVKEEIMGLEDCFKYSSQVMGAYATAEIELRDNSVELYLLNHWVKDLSLRDLIDRVSFCSISYNQKFFLTLFSWLMTHSLSASNQDQQWQIEDFRKVAILLAKNSKEDTIREFFEQCVQKFGVKKVREFMEIQLMHSQQEFKIFIDWFSTQYKVQETQKTHEKVSLPKINIDQVEGAQVNNSRLQTRQIQDQELQSALKTQVDESVCSSARAKSAGMHSQLYQKLREKRKNSNQRRQEETENPGVKYEDIINRLENQLQSVQPPKKFDETLTQPIQQQPSVQQQIIKTHSSGFYSNVSNRYDNLKNDDELEESKTMNSEDFRQNIKQNIEVKVQDNTSKTSYFQDVQNALMQSQVKEDKQKIELEKLEEERKRIERERELLMREKNKETQEWRNKYEDMREQHEDVISNLQEANKCYLNQVSENEDLRKQLRMMQDQHQMMMRKFEEIEKKISQKEETQKEQDRERNMYSMSLKQGSPHPQQQEVSKITKLQIVEEEKLAKIEEVFKDENSQMMHYQSDAEIGVKKIQELLLNSDSNVNEEIGIPLYFYYSKVKSFTDKLIMIKALNESLSNEDVLYAISNETYKAMLVFLLKVFSVEKAKIESHQIRNSMSQSTTKQNEQNEITLEVQKLVSKLLNSKEFTISLVTLFAVLKSSMPEDLSLELTGEQQQILRVIMRCISRITKALHSEHPDLIRAFDVLIEMQKIFLKHPPENLREDLPSLQEFDYVYRGLKDVTDKLMELQPEKVVSFLKFICDQPTNAFTKYMQQMMMSKNQMNEQNDNNAEDDEYSYSQSGNY